MTTNAPPPHSDESESYLIGSILMEPAILDRFAGVLSPAMFYHSATRAIFKTMKELRDNHEAIEIGTVWSHLRTTGSDKDCSAEAVATVLDTIGTPAAAASFVEELRGLWLLRAMRSTMYGSIEGAEGATASQAMELLSAAESALFVLRKGCGATEKDTCMRAVLSRTFDALELAGKQSGSLVTTGLATLDLFARLGPGKLTVLAARPSMGKSAFAKDILLHNAFRGIPCLLFSLEDPEIDWTHRAWASMTGIPHDQVQVGALGDHEWNEIMSASDKLAKSPLHIIDDMLGVPEIRALSRQMVADHGISLIVIDYLQLMPRPAGPSSTADKVAWMSAEIKRMARELDVHVILVSQLNRGCESRTGTSPPCIPVASDLRDSGALEQDADLILFPYRHAEYDDSADPTKALIRVGKQRGGRKGDAAARWKAAQVRFEDVPDATYGGPR